MEKARITVYINRKHYNYDFGTHLLEHLLVKDKSIEFFSACRKFLNTDVIG